jgi:3-oxoadipate enol-lactonase
VNLERGGVRLYWTASGHGPTVVLTHGLLADLRSFDAIARNLADAGFRVVRWDVRGHGRSTRADPSTTFHDLVLDLGAVLDSASEGPVVLVGHALGGLVSIGAALDRPDRVHALSLWSVDAAPNPVADVVGAAVNAARTVSIRPFALALEPLWTRRSATSRDRATVALQVRVATTASPGGLLPVVECLRTRGDLVAPAGLLDVPVQVLWGQRDRVVRPNAGRDLLAAVRRAEGGAIPEASHLIHADRPDVAWDALRAWLTRVAPISGRAS